MIDEKLEKVLNSCRVDNRAAQKEIYEFYYSFVFSIVRRYVGSFEESKEVTNDVFFKIFRKYMVEFVIGHGKSGLSVFLYILIFNH